MKYKIEKALKNFIFAKVKNTCLKGDVCTIITESNTTSTRSIAVIKERKIIKIPTKNGRQ